MYITDSVIGSFIISRTTRIAPLLQPIHRVPRYIARGSWLVAGARTNEHFYRNSLITSIEIRRSRHRANAPATIGVANGEYP